MIGSLTRRLIPRRRRTPSRRGVRWKDIAPPVAWGPNVSTMAPIPVPTDCRDTECCSLLGTPHNGGECCAAGTDWPATLYLTPLWNSALCGAWGGVNCACLINYGSFELTFQEDAIAPGWGGWVSEVFGDCNPGARSCGGLGPPTQCEVLGHGCQRWILGCVNTGAPSFGFALWLPCLSCAGGTTEGYPYVTPAGNTIASPYSWTSGSALGITCSGFSGTYRVNAYCQSGCSFPGIGPCFLASVTR